MPLLDEYFLLQFPQSHLATVERNSLKFLIDLKKIPSNSRMHPLNAQNRSSVALWLALQQHQHFECLSVRLRDPTDHPAGLERSAVDKG